MIQVFALCYVIQITVSVNNEQELMLKEIQLSSQSMSKIFG